jgi:hypothetical protein
MESNIVRIDRSEIESLLKADLNGTVLCTIFFASPMDDNKKWRKTGNPYWGKGLLKECAVNGLVGYNYREAIRRLTYKEMVKAGKAVAEIKDFVAKLVFGQRAWGTLGKTRKIVEHTNKKGEFYKYVSMFVRSASTPVYRMGKEIIDSKLVTAFLSESEKPHTQDHLEGEIVPRDIRFDHILMIKAWKKTYIVSDLEPLTTEDAVKSAPKNPRLEEHLKHICDIAKLEQDGELPEMEEQPIE